MNVTASKIETKNPRGFPPHLVFVAGSIKDPREHNSNANSVNQAFWLAVFSHMCKSSSLTHQDTKLGCDGSFVSTIEINVFDRSCGAGAAGGAKD